MNTTQTVTDAGKAPREVNDLLWIRKQVRFARQNSTNRGLKSLATIIEARTERAKAIANSQF